MNRQVKRVTPKGFKVIQGSEGGKRFQWLASAINLNRYQYGAEIGCHRGNTTRYLLQHCPSLKTLYAVDLWGMPPQGCSDQYDRWNFTSAENRFKAVTGGFTALTTLKGISWDMADEVEDGSLDFIFIDADHETESVKKDIIAWTPKLKEDGVISGHDTHFPTVVVALNELIPDWVSVKIDHCWFAHKEDVIL